MIPKFRAWDRTRNEMNYKVLVGNCDTDDENWTCPSIWIEDRKSWLHFDDYKCIMQSTGIKDENDKEIFEGDILKVKIMNGQSWLETVRYNDGKAMFVSKEVNRKVPESPLYDLFNTDLFVVEIIGNVYENQELLEVPD